MYTHLEATLHDAFWAAEGEPAELPLLELFFAAHLAGGGTGLELGCGSGRLLLPLLAAGYPVEGLDNAGEMLALCRENAALLGLDPVLHEQDIASLDLPGRYRAIALPAFTLQLLDDPAAALARVRKHLRPGGGLFLTTFFPHAELENELPENEWFEDRSAPLPRNRTATLHTRHHLDRDRQLLTRQHRYEVVSTNGTVLDTHESTQRIRYFTPADLEALLTNTGFTPLDAIVNLDPDDDGPTEDADTLTIIATTA